jgi:hypothetical protein
MEYLYFMSFTNPPHYRHPAGSKNLSVSASGKPRPRKLPCHFHRPATFTAIAYMAFP